MSVVSDGAGYARCDPGFDAQNRHEEESQMSADDTVIVLQTAGKNGQGREFRVAHVQAAECMVTKSDYPSPGNPVFNRAWVLDAFRNARVHTSMESAAREAAPMGRHAEYGVQFVDHPTVHFPASDRRRKRRMRFQTNWRRHTSPPAS